MKQFRNFFFVFVFFGFFLEESYAQPESFEVLKASLFFDIEEKSSLLNEFILENKPYAYIEHEGLVFLFVPQHKNENIAIAHYVCNHLFDLRDQKGIEEYVKLYRHIRALDVFLYNIQTGEVFEADDVKCFWNLPQGAAYREAGGKELEIVGKGPQPDRIWVEEVSN